MLERINAYFEDKEDLLVELVSRVVRIDSTMGIPEAGKPFGPGPAAALEEFLTIAEALGLPGENLEGFVGAIDLNSRPDGLHILGHLDVVDGGEGWTVTQPFEPKVVDGCLYGRGTDDDKGPMIASLLAMKAVKDLGVPLTKNVRLILGTDEETGFRDIHWYFQNYPYAPYTISPDADFPIINIEKGHYQPVFGAKWEKTDALPRVLTFTGGPRLNMVPPKAEALVAGLSLLEIEGVRANLGLEPEITFHLTEEPTGIRIQCVGVPAHGSTPEEGHNAQTALAALLAALPLADCPSTAAIRGMVKLFPHGDFTGEALGIAQRDELSGHLSLAFTRMELNDTGFEGRFDSRTPLCSTDENIIGVTEAAMTALGWTVNGTIDQPHYVPAEDPFIQTLGKCYEMYSGRKSQCVAIGGGTYVHDIPGGVAFGASMPGFVSNLHGPDEKVNIKDLLTATKIYAQVIVELCK